MGLGWGPGWPLGKAAGGHEAAERGCCWRQGWPDSRTQLDARLLQPQTGDARALNKQGKHLQSQEESLRAYVGCATRANGPGVAKFTLPSALVCCMGTVPGSRAGKDLAAPPSPPE